MWGSAADWCERWKKVPACTDTDRCLRELWSSTASVFYPALLCCLPPRLSYPCYNTAIHHPVKAERCRKPRDDVPFYLDQLSNRFLLSLSFTDWLIEWFVWVTFTPLFQRANKVTQHYKHFMHTVLNLCLFNLHSSLCPDFLSNIPLMSCYSRQFKFSYLSPSFFLISAFILTQALSLRVTWPPLLL